MGIATQITVKVRTKDAKFLGTSMGGALVTLRDEQTGELLSKGVTQGSTGDTEHILQTPHSRSSALSDEMTASFHAELDLEEPRLVTVTAYGPLAQRQSANQVSSSQWIIPGRHITAGDAWMVELRGFAVDISSPPAHSHYPADTEYVEVQSNVIMM